MYEYYLSALIIYLLFVYLLKPICDFVRAIRFYQWKYKRDKLSLEEFVQSLEIQYYREKMKDFYNEKE